jgi:hypothetical protein
MARGLQLKLHDPLWHVLQDPQLFPLAAAADPTHVPEPLQASLAVHPFPSVHDDPDGSLPVQLLVASLHISEQSLSPSAPWHGFPELMHCPDALHVSVPVQNWPSLQDEPLGSLPWQLLAFSSHVSEQSASPSGPSQGLPMPTQTPEPLHVSVDVQNRPSLQDVPTFSSATMQTLPTHEATWHCPTAGHCVASLHATQVPSPSQTWPPFSVHAVSAGRFSTPQVDAMQVTVRQSVSSPPQSAGASQPMHAPRPSHSPAAHALPAPSGV